MDKHVKSLLLSFALGLTSEQEDELVVQLLNSGKDHLAYILEIEKELIRKCNLLGIKKRNYTIVRHKLIKLGIKELNA